ncbi:GNAT family N-acetyltransferase [Bacillus carboniphilus]|uniref:GNAT family N-acetyltransferase n=1 Tax=Bacillus carboniphilus TaxID=86663 RepID=A0ABY9JTK0_9BACI|nr:GNAT family N-acetyltransferase [Bacillus carboniphilus]WLR42727.1 GNAT family N-acetyltransferase [Bacillus carboniphilus]
MIRRLTEADHDLCMSLLEKHPAENLFIIGDIENHGYHTSFQQLWGEFNKVGQIVAILLKYHGNYIIYGPHTFNAKGFAEIINSDLDFQILSGLDSMVSQIEPFINKPFQSKRKMHYAKLETIKDTYRKTIYSIKKATPDDLPKIQDLISQIEEFTSTATIEQKRKGIEGGNSRIFYIEENEVVISSASTTAENSSSAMIVAVCTHPNHKRRGLATECLLNLCSELLTEGKTLCLFYDNPEAGSIYKRIGFEDIGFWTMNKI